MAEAAPEADVDDSIKQNAFARFTANISVAKLFTLFTY